MKNWISVFFLFGILLLSLSNCIFPVDPIIVTVEDFETWPPTDVTGGWATTYFGGDENGGPVPFISSTGSRYLRFTYDALGSPGTWGHSAMGYVWAQKTYNFPDKGTLKFKIVHVGYDVLSAPAAPNYALEAWIDLDPSQISSPSTLPDWSSRTRYNDFTEVSIPVNSGGIKRLTIKANKTNTSYDEDLVRLDDITFEYIP